MGDALKNLVTKIGYVGKALWSIPSMKSGQTLRFQDIVVFERLLSRLVAVLSDVTVTSVAIPALAE